ncbi:hypothetical protein HYPSUDRAFT_134957 [Hypholoma sublateritium FD-334 SS-4]|uniref:Zinc finger PHD-type domain-containing protein n=1 Tax=Hypholoma sublateritium (strain FD-334 SS-4) TaxID=945553 RepID=A0A0D2LDB4_HYPSF|nr:hypothetical protein HYPSUDRAFT_134957 [Hypholoma sublateritium FD-334 SS-4]
MAAPSALSTIEYGRSKRKLVPSKKVTDALNECLCGQVLGPTDDLVIQCKAKGCETQWYHLDCIKLDQIPLRWVYETYVGSGGGRGGKCTCR